VKTSSPIRFVDPRSVLTEKKVASDVWYKDQSGRIRAGLWSAGPDCAAIDLTDHADELCVILEGTVRLTDASSGHTEIYRAGDTFLIPSGFNGTWESVGAVRKFFLIHEEQKSS
jgi:uncharacterized cupin superfamily protein